MRPPGETHHALIRAAQAYRIEHAQSGQGATLRELVERSQVGYKVARALVAKMKERGQLEVVGERRVPNRNRPAAEYAPAQPKVLTSDGAGGWVDLNAAMSSWMQ